MRTLNCGDKLIGYYYDTDNKAKLVLLEKGKKYSSKYTIIPKDITSIFNFSDAKSITAFVEELNEIKTSIDALGEII